MLDGDEKGARTSNEESTNYYLCTGPIENIFKGVVKGLKVRCLLEKAKEFADEDFIRSVVNLGLKPEETLYIWGLPAGEESGHRKVKGPYLKLKENDIVFIKRWKSERISKDRLEEYAEDIMRELAINDKGVKEKIIYEIKNRLIVTIARVAFKHPSNTYLERIESAHREYPLCLYLSKNLWNTHKYVNLIFFRLRKLTILTDVTDEEIKNALGYNHLSLDKFANSCRFALMLCRRYDRISISEILQKVGILGKDPSLGVVLEALEIAYFEILRENPAMVYQTLNDLLPRVNEILRSRGYRRISLKELEHIVDKLHEKYWLKGFIRHPKVPGMPVIIEFRNRIKTREESFFNW